MVSPQIKTGIGTELDRVKSIGQATAAANAALRSIHDAYSVISDLPWLGDQRANSRRELDEVRHQIESLHKKLGTVAKNPVDPTAWKAMRKQIETAFGVIASIQGAANYQPKTSNWTILATSITEAPGVFTKTVATSAKAIVSTAGDVAGSALGGVFGGLGIWSVVLIVVGAFILALRLGVF
jgi:hypothetical protein